MPLRTNENGVIRIGRTRVTLQSVISDFHRGASAEEIVHHYTTLNLSDVYPVLGYYLANRAEVDEYVRRERQLANEARREYEADHPNDPLRAKLLAKLKGIATK
ncbi:MAG: DUF433 domain-containing protein [Anaerolineae bacterium]|nr:DUF433 domain-containing protein [Anaerolineae bacterium]